ncbi:MAG: HAD-IIA family hydrolase [Oscillospiraceae bacterium]|nr:HAD-IIA family hydrolase [Oscillospiraceae bacterium]
MDLTKLRERKGFICDMDGVIYHGDRLLPGVHEFVSWLKRENKSYLFLTNASQRTPLELKQKVERMGLEIEPKHFYTSALATAAFLADQSPGCSAYIIGGPGLYNALYDVGITSNDVNPDYVVVGETNSYNYESILRAVTHVLGGAKLIGTNPDMTGPSETGLIPACRALMSPIELASGRSAYYVGKPNALMMRTGLRILDVHSEDSVMIGDRMDTDIIAGIETGLDTALVLTGVTSREAVKTFPYRPKYILNGVGDIAEQQ